MKHQHKSQSASRHPLRSLPAIAAGIMVGVLLCIGVLALSASRNRSTAAETELDYHEKIDMILEYLQLFYLEDLREEELGDILAKGLMSSIGDKYAEYYTQEEFERMMEDTSGEYAGIGVQIVMTEEEQVQVYRVFADSPAEEAGIQLMDLIVEADGRRDFETLDELVSLVRGAEGTTVDLVISRGGEEIPITVERRKIVTDSVYGEMLTDGLGYIQLSEFNTATITQFNTILDELLAEGMTSVIMDLRGNPGGDYDSVVAICDRVLPEGPIVTVEDKLGGVVTENSDATCLDIPMVILIDENTASAAELFTMAVTDYDMAQTVGVTTYGKGVVQSFFRMIDGSGLKFTTEKYYGPKGNSVQDNGVVPDHEIAFPEEAYEDGVISLDEDVQLKKAVEILGFDLDLDALAQERSAAGQDQIATAAEEVTEEAQ